MTTLITGGTVVSPEGATPMDVVVDGETIAALVPPGSHAGRGRRAARGRRPSTPRGKYVLPGGVDVHTHMELPFGGTNASDTFETGTRAAAWGGTTTIIDFAVQRTGERVMDGLEAWHAKAEGKCAIDYGFHMILGGVDDDSLAGDGHASSSTRASPASSCSWPTPACSTATTGKILRAMQKAVGERGDGDDARRERHRHRRAGAAGAGPRRDRPDLPRPHPPGGAWRRRRRSGRSSWPRSRAARSTSSTCRPARPSSGWPRPATPASTCSARRARSTST